jgi:hypothetical protein
MTPEQLQQMANQQMLEWFSVMPFWMKALMVLQLLSVLATVICLPLITWKLYSGNRPANPVSPSPAEQMRLQQIRDRRAALQHLSGPAQPASDAAVREKTDKDSRFMPKS